VRDQRGTVRIVRRWLDEGTYDRADRVLDVVLAQLDTTPQRGAGWLPRWFSTPAKSLRYGVAAAFIIAVVIAANVLPRSVAGPAPTPTPAPTAASAPPRLPNAELNGGRYLLAGAHGITVEAPARGWAGYCCPGDPVIVNGQDLPRFASLRYADATLMTLYLDPCHWSQSKTRVPKGASSIAAVLSALPGRSGSPPEAVTLGGRPAVHVRLTVPGDASISDCYGHEYRTWNVGAGDPRGQDGPGQIDDIYLVDIGGSTVVLDASYFPETSMADRRALNAMLDSLRIE
jgi:hypothetical protein